MQFPRLEVARDRNKESILSCQQPNFQISMPIEKQGAEKRFTFAQAKHTPRVLPAK